LGIHIAFNPLFPTGRAEGEEANWAREYVNQIYEIIEMGHQKQLPIITEIILPVKFLFSVDEYNKINALVENISNIIFNFHECRAYQTINEIHIACNLNVYGCPQLIHMSFFCKSG
jgi:hypothetical protein